MTEKKKLSPDELAKLAAGGAVVRWKFHDGDMAVPLVRVIAVENDQLRWVIDHQREQARDNGSKGGRPVKPRPPEHEIARLHMERTRTTRDESTAGWNRARTWLTKKLAAEYEVDDKTARAWVTECLGPKPPQRPKKKRKKQKRE